MRPLQPSSCFRFLLTLFVAPFLLLGTASGQQSEDSPETNVAQSANFELGLDGIYRTGRWTRIRLQDLTAGASYTLETLDGDGVRVSIPLTVPPAATSQEVYIPAGPMGAPVELYRELPDQPRERVEQLRLLSESASTLKPWVAALGDPLGIDEIGSSARLGKSGIVDVSMLNATESIPRSPYGYDGVDWIIVTGSAASLLESLDGQQKEALRAWVLDGGKLLLSLGSSGDRVVASLPWLQDAIGFDQQPNQVTADPIALETFLSATEPVGEFAATQFQLIDTADTLLGITTTRQTLPLLIERRYGFGELVVFSGGLDEEPIRSWSQRADLISRLINELAPKRRRSGQVGPRGDIRYTDVAGQLRASLDQNVTNSGVSFSAVAIILFALIGLVGPIDYLLVNRWLGRPLLGWLSFPLSVVAISGALIAWRGSDPPPTVRQLTILDLDTVTGYGRGWTTMQVSAGEAQRVNLSVQPAGSVASKSVSDLVVGPWGFAGDIYGGIEIAGEDVRLPAYTLLPSQVGAKPGVTPSSIEGLPFPPRSSKSIWGRWRFDAQLDQVASLGTRPGSDLLTGEVINPLPVDLLDGYLIYRNLAYALPTRLPPGATGMKLEVMQQRNFQWRLNRRRVGESSSTGETWNPSDTQNLDRLVEILMFYDWAGGDEYTGITNGPLKCLDLSQLLNTDRASRRDRAILLGRVALPEVDLQSTTDSGEESGMSRVVETYVRVTLPVDHTASTRE